MSRAIKLAAINALLFALLFAAAELYFRHHATYLAAARAQSLKESVEIEGNPFLLLRDTDEGKRHIPDVHLVIKNHYLSNRDIRIDINSLGFRGPEIPENKPANEYRILVLGDSIAFASYLQYEETYVNRIGQYLSGAMKDKQVRMINAGGDDIGLSEEMDILESRGLDTRPDLVIVAFYLNDSRPPWGFAKEQGSKGFLLRHSVFLSAMRDRIKLTMLLKESGGYRMKWAFMQDKLQWRTNPDDFSRLVAAAAYDWGAAWTEESWTKLGPLFDRFSRLQREHGFKAALVCFPVKFQVESEFIDDAPQKRLMDKAREMGIPCLDLLPLMRANADKELFYDQCHPTPEANRIIGQAIAKFLEDRVL